MEARPLYPPFTAILTRLVEYGDSPAIDLGPAMTTSQHLAKLIERGYVSAHRDLTAPRHRNLYQITDLGREVLAAGVTPYSGRGSRGINVRFTATHPPLRAEPVAPAVCVHHWDIGDDLAQTGKCRKCPTTREFRPRYGAELLLVGEGQVRPSERFPAGVARA